LTFKPLRALSSSHRFQARRSITSMTPGDQQADEAARLEAALLRIQQARAVRSGAASPAAGRPDAAGEVAARLDALIAELRALLGTQG
jgi:hypothetical protein